MKALDCHRAEELIIVGLDEGLDEGRATLLQEHIDRCPSCRLYSEEMRRVLGLVASDLPADPGEGYWTRYQVSLEAKLLEKEVARGWWGIPWKALGAAATAAVVLLAVYGGIFHVGKQQNVDVNTQLIVLNDLSQVLGPGDDEETPSLSLRDWTTSAMISQQVAGYANGTPSWFEVEEESDYLLL